MQQPLRLPLVLDLTDITGQLSSTSERVYRHDAEVFACWIQEQGLALDTLYLLTRSHLIAYRKYLGETYAKATAARMFSVARRILQEYVYQGNLAANPAAGIKTFSVGNETPYTTLKKEEAQDLLKTIDTTSTKGKRDYAILSLLLRTGLRRSECSALNIGDLKLEQGHTIAVIIGRRLRTAIHEENEHIGALLREGMYRLRELREDDPDAAMLVVAKDQDHAKKLAKRMQQELGITPIVAVSEDGDVATGAIKGFKNSREQCIIAVNMISEGVNILASV